MIITADMLPLLNLILAGDPGLALTLAERMAKASEEAGTVVGLSRLLAMAVANAPKPKDLAGGEVNEAPKPLDTTGLGPAAQSMAGQIVDLLRAREMKMGPAEIRKALGIPNDSKTYKDAQTWLLSTGAVQAEEQGPKRKYWVK